MRRTKNGFCLTHTLLTSFSSPFPTLISNNSQKGYWLCYFSLTLYHLIQTLWIQIPRKMRKMRGFSYYISHTSHKSLCINCQYICCRFRSVTECTAYFDNQIGRFNFSLRNINSELNSQAPRTKSESKKS